MTSKDSKYKTGEKVYAIGRTSQGITYQLVTIEYTRTIEGRYYDAILQEHSDDFIGTPHYKIVEGC